MLLERGMQSDAIADAFGARHASRDGDQVPVLALAARHRLDIAVRLDFDASAAHDAVLLLDAR